MKSFVLVLKLTLAFPTEAHLPGLCHQRSCLLLGLPLVSSVAPSPRIHTFRRSPLGLFRPAGPPPSTLEPGALSPPPTSNQQHSGSQELGEAALLSPHLDRPEATAS